MSNIEYDEEKGGATSKLTKKAIQYFKRPAITCQYCGQAMTFSDQWGPWERKWSLHRSCYEHALNELDRRSGIASERQQFEERMERRRQELRAKGFDV